jgi:hypothetical protein
MEKFQAHKFGMQSDAKVSKVCEVELAFAVLSEEGDEHAVPLLSASCYLPSSFTRQGSCALHDTAHGKRGVLLRCACGPSLCLKACSLNATDTIQAVL